MPGKHFDAEDMGTKVPRWVRHLKPQISVMKANNVRGESREDIRPETGAVKGGRVLGSGGIVCCGSLLIFRHLGFTCFGGTVPAGGDYRYYYSQFYWEH